MVETAPYGTWPSPISAELVVAGAPTIGEVRLDGDNVYWLEGRPEEGGRYVVVRRSPDGTTVDVTPEDTNVRTRVHEYGGGSCFVSDGTVWYVEFTDQRLYRLHAGGLVPLTPEPDRRAAVRYADFDLSPDGSWLAAVRETHHGERADQVVNELVAIPADGGGEQWVLATGRHFYAAPRWSPDGRHLAFVTWDHPDMPWDATELVVVTIEGQRRSTAATIVAGRDGAESVLFPRWSPDGVLHCISDRSGWWNLYRCDDARLTNLAPVEADLGQPLWELGREVYGWLDDGRIAVVATDRAVERVALLDATAATVEPLPLSHTSVRSLATSGSSVVFAGAGPTTPQEVVRVDASSGAVQVLHRTRDVPVDEAWLARPQPIRFATGDGDTAHAFLYRPTSPTHRGPDDARPPLLVTAHGGPTGHRTSALNLGTQFWTSRGFAVVDVNYRGSTGFGRRYREALRGRWGIVDAGDCIAAAQGLADGGAVDAERLVVRGGSAGGYTTLRALTSSDVFAAGASYYGVADLAALVEETHKFESRYLDRLVGRYPEAAEVYRDRSPIHHTDRLDRPVIVFQGLEDEIVPPSQAEAIVAALDRKGLPYAYLTFDGEQHGFRRAENQRRCLQAELAFYGRIFDFDPADDLPDLDIPNLKR